jgi:hypothetical protein
MKNAIRERKSKVLGLFLCFLLLGIDYSFASYNNYSQFKTLSVSMSNSTLREVLKTIEKSSQFVFFYLDDAVNLERKVSIDSKNKNIEEISKVLRVLIGSLTGKYLFPEKPLLQPNSNRISGKYPDVSLI